MDTSASRIYVRFCAPPSLHTIDADFPVDVTWEEVRAAALNALWEPLTGIPIFPDFSFSIARPVTGEIAKNLTAIPRPEAKEMKEKLANLGIDPASTNQSSRALIMLNRPERFLPVPSVAGAVQFRDQLKKTRDAAGEQKGVTTMQFLYSESPVDLIRQNAEATDPTKLISNWLAKTAVDAKALHFKLIEMYAGYAFRDPALLTLSREDFATVIKSNYLRFPYINNARAGISERYVFDAIVRWCNAQSGRTRSLVDEFFAADSLFRHVRFTLCAGEYYYDPVLMQALQDLLGEKHVAYYKHFKAALLALPGERFHLAEYQPVRGQVPGQVDASEFKSSSSKDFDHDFGEGELGVRPITLPGILAQFDVGPRFPRFPPHFECFQLRSKPANLQSLGFQSLILRSERLQASTPVVSLRVTSPNPTNAPKTFDEVALSSQVSLTVTPLKPLCDMSALSIIFKDHNTSSMIVSAKSTTIISSGSNRSKSRSDLVLPKPGESITLMYDMTSETYWCKDIDQKWDLLLNLASNSPMQVCVRDDTECAVAFTFSEFLHPAYGDVSPVTPPESIEVIKKP